MVIDLKRHSSFLGNDRPLVRPIRDAFSKNPGEDFETSAVRELEEETGYIAGNTEYLMTINTTVAFCNEKITIYKATNLSLGETHWDRDEYMEVECYTLEEIIKMISEGEITDSKTISAIMYYAYTR